MIDKTAEKYKFLAALRTAAEDIVTGGKMPARFILGGNIKCEQFSPLYLTVSF